MVYFHKTGKVPDHPSLAPLIQDFLSENEIRMYIIGCLTMIADDVFFQKVKKQRFAVIDKNRFPAIQALDMITVSDMIHHVLLSPFIPQCYEFLFAAVPGKTAVQHAWDLRIVIMTDNVHIAGHFVVERAYFHFTATEGAVAQRFHYSSTAFSSFFARW